MKHDSTNESKMESNEAFFITANLKVNSSILYENGMNNLLAEIPNFYLQNTEYTSYISEIEDKFKNLMMIKGYEVYRPVEDIWGSDFILKKGNNFLTVQVKSSQSDKPVWALQTNNKVKYKDVCTHMAFVYLKEDKDSGVWMIPTEKLPNTTSMSHITFKKLVKGYEIELQI